jgi:hypothetical protein
MKATRLLTVLLALLIVACIPTVSSQSMGQTQVANTDPSPTTGQEAVTAPFPAAGEETDPTPSSPVFPGATATAYIPLIVSEGTTPPPPPPPGDGDLIADHFAVDNFDHIPDSILAETSAIRALQLHASTGNRIDGQGLNCVQGTHTNERCAQYPDYKYDRRNWLWEEFDPPTTDPFKKTDLFVAEVHSRSASFDAFGMKLCYLDTDPDTFEYYRDELLALEAAYPNKFIIWWTQALKPGTGDCGLIENLNTQIRAYARAHHKPLLDLADIESHDPEGNPCFTGCETLCPEYAVNPNQPENGHMNNDGNIRVARAYWWLMARLAGWDG